MFSSGKVPLQGPHWTSGLGIRGSRAFGDIWNEDVQRLERCRLVLGETADGRNWADTVRLPSDVTIVDREGSQLTTTMRSSNGQQEGQLDCQVNQGGLTKGLEERGSHEMQD